MESIIEHKFLPDEIFFVYPQGEEGKFFPDMLIKVMEGQEAYLTEKGKIIKNLRIGTNSIVENFSGFVVFLNNKNFQKKWGTLEPISFKDKNNSLNYFKAYGTVDFSFEKHKDFVEKLILQKKFFLTEEFVDFLRNLIFYEFSRVLKETKIISKEDLENLLKENLGLIFNNFGLKISNFEIKGGNFIEEKEETDILICKKCKKEMVVKANFCPFCGEKVSNACPSCKKEVPEFAKFCPFCGSMLK